MDISFYIADDELPNIKLLHKMIEKYCSGLKPAGYSTKPENAVKEIKALKPQLLFLDIEMPGLNGFGLLKQIEPLDCEVIFVTAYGHHAIHAFEYNATGYLTKPLAAPKLTAAVSKAVGRIEKREVNKNIFSLLEKSISTKQEDERIVLSTQKGLIFINEKEILYCESKGNYTTFFTINDRQILVSRQIGEFEDLLPVANFMRIHDRFIVNLRHIKEYIRSDGGELLLENGMRLPVAVRRKEEFVSRFEKWFRRK
jgi:two-component system, LytTR family, response regulator